MRTAVPMVLFLACPSTALAFGEAGTVVPGGQVVLSHQTISTPPEQGGRFSFTRAALAPTLDYFVAENVSVGVGLLGGMSFYDGAMSYVFGGSMALGYHIGFSETVGLYPRGAVQWAYSGTAVDGPVTPDASSHVSVRLATPLLYHAGHLFIGAGPEIDAVVSSRRHVQGGDDTADARSLTIGVQTVIGGWF